MAEPRVKRDHQVLVVGRKGSGKSILIRHLSAFVRGRLVVLNVKRDPDLTDYLVDRYGEDAVAIVDGKPDKLRGAIRDKRVVVYVFQDALSIDEADRVYQQLVRWHDLTVLLDESYGPTTSARVARGLAQFLQHGRFKRLRHLAATQRPRHIAKPLLTEADHIVFFPTGFAAEDFDTVAANMALKPAELEQVVHDLLSERSRRRLGEHAHLWYDRTTNTLHMRPSVPLA